MNAHASEPQAPTMTIAQMREIIKSAKPGDKLKVVFANKTFNGDLKGRVYMILAMNGRSYQLRRTADVQLDGGRRQR